MAFAYYSQGMDEAVYPAGGALVGALQTFLLRELVDNSMAKKFLSNTSSTPPLLMKQLKGFGSPSALFGIAGGFVGLALGLASLLKGAVIKSVKVGGALFGYGLTALITGALSGVYPTPAWQAGIQVDPNNPIGVSNVKRNVVISGSTPPPAPQVTRTRILSA